MTIKNSTKNLNFPSQQTHGFTLIEFMVALAILAIMLAVALPSFSHWQSKNEADYVTDLIYRQLQGAREHAINHNTVVTLCGTNAAGACSASDFSTLTMFIDAGTAAAVDDEDTVLVETALKAPRGSVTFKAALNAKTMRFKSDGSSSTTASFVYCPKNKNNTQLQRKITLNIAGRSYTGATQSGDCPQ